MKLPSTQFLERIKKKVKIMRAFTFTEVSVSKSELYVRIYDLFKCRTLHEDKRKKLVEKVMIVSHYACFDIKI